MTGILFGDNRMISWIKKLAPYTLKKFRLKNISEKDATAMLVDLLRSFKSKLHHNLISSDSRAKIQDGDFVIGLLQAVASACAADLVFWNQHQNERLL